MAKGVKHVALVAHNDCGMTKVPENKQAMIDALVEQGWYKDRATDFVTVNASRYAIEDEVDSLKGEWLRLRRLFHHIEIAPLFVSLAGGKMYMPAWYEKMLILNEVDKPVGEESSVSDVDLLGLI
jgi:carbonic anhydrase